MMKRAILTLVVLLCAAPAYSQSYPLGGKWGYDNSPGSGPIDCSNRPTIEFQGNRRFETGGKAPPDYKNVSVQQQGQDTYRVVDRFFNGMQDGKVAYTLRRVDDDHIEIKHEIGGATFALRACN